MSRLEEGVVYIIAGLLALFIGFNAFNEPLQLGFLVLFCLVLIIIGFVKVFGRGK